MYKLRDFQAKTGEVTRDLYNDGKHRILNVLATGLGKSIIIGKLGDYFPDHFEDGLLYLVHRRKLVYQQAKKFAELWPNLRVETEMSGERAQADADIVVASTATLGRANSSRIRKFDGRFGIIAVDEAHRALTTTAQRVLNWFGVGDNPRITDDDTERVSIGFTATPNRTDGRGLWPLYDAIGVEYDILWGMMNGWLAPIKVLAIPTATNIGETKVGRDGEFIAADLSKYVNVHERNDLVVRSYAESGRGKAIAFTVDIGHAEALAKEFQECGIEAYATHSGNGIHEMPDEKRQEIESGHLNGEFPVMVGVDVFSEGYDDPEVECILMARPTKSLLWYTQALGRGVRPISSPPANGTIAKDRRSWIDKSKKPNCMLIDFTDNAGEHKDGLIGAADLFAVPKGAIADSESQAELSDLLQVMNIDEGVEKTSKIEKAKNVTSLPALEFIQLNLLDAQEADKNVRKVSSNAWVKDGDSHLLHIPSIDSAIRLECDALGRHRAKLISGNGHFMSGTVRFEDRKEAIEYYDKYVAKKFPEDKYAVMNKSTVKDEIKDARRAFNLFVRKTNFALNYDLGKMESILARKLGSVKTVTSMKLLKERTNELIKYRENYDLDNTMIKAWINSTFN